MKIIFIAVSISAILSCSKNVPVKIGTGWEKDHLKGKVKNFVRTEYQIKWYAGEYTLITNNSRRKTYDITGKTLCLVEFDKSGKQIRSNNFVYDQRNRLRQAVVILGLTNGEYRNTWGENDWAIFDFDVNGNCTQKKVLRKDNTPLYVTQYKYSNSIKKEETCYFDGTNLFYKDTFSNDAQGRITALIEEDRVAGYINFAYDGFGNLIKKSGDLPREDWFGTVLYKYDERKNLIETVAHNVGDPRVTLYKYSSNGKLIEIDWLDSQQSLYFKSLSLFNRDGLITNQNDYDKKGLYTKTVWQYDSNSNLINESSFDGLEIPTHEILLEYDRYQNLTRVRAIRIINFQEELHRQLEYIAECSYEYFQ